MSESTAESCPEPKELRFYRIAIDDEHYHRNMFQSRLSYHTNILIALLAAIGAGYLNAKEPWHFAILGLFSFLFAGLSLHAIGAVQRIYDHFIEMLDEREVLEVRLGLRDKETLDKDRERDSRLLEIDTAKLYWPHGLFFRKGWVRTRKNKGYFARMKKLLVVFFIIGILSAVFSFSVASPTPLQRIIFPQIPASACSAALRPAM